MKTDPSAGRAVATRHSSGCALVMAAAVVRTKCGGKCDFGEHNEAHNEADLGTKMVDLRRMTSLLKGTSLRPPAHGWWAATVPHSCTGSKSRVLIWNVKNNDETSGWFWVCMGVVIVFLMVLSNGLPAIPITDDCRRWKVTDK